MRSIDSSTQLGLSKEGVHLFAQVIWHSPQFFLTEQAKELKYTLSVQAYLSGGVQGAEGTGHGDKVSLPEAKVKVQRSPVQWLPTQLKSEVWVSVET